jgi:hypothetical protein
LLHLMNSKSAKATNSIRIVLIPVIYGDAQCFLFQLPTATMGGGLCQGPSE